MLLKYSQMEYKPHNLQVNISKSESLMEIPLITNSFSVYTNSVLIRLQITLLFDFSLLKLIIEYTNYFGTKDIGGQRARGCVFVFVSIKNL